MNEDQTSGRGVAPQQPAEAVALIQRLKSLRSWITDLRDEAPAIRSQAAILIGDTIAALKTLRQVNNEEMARIFHRTQPKTNSSRFLPAPTEHVFAFGRELLRAAGAERCNDTAAFGAAQPPAPPAPSADLGPCYCPPDACQAPVIMGRRTPCLRSAAPPQPPVPEPSADAVREALAELVWLKDLKDRTEGPVYSGRQGELEEYRRRKPLAWAAASVALAASPKDQP